MRLHANAKLRSTSRRNSSVFDVGRSPVGQATKKRVGKANLADAFNHSLELDGLMGDRY